jgi:4-hydroxybenzoate polyprenyltransferase
MKPGRIIMIAGGVLMLISTVLDWAQNPDPQFADRTGNHPFKYPLGAISWVLVVLVGIGALLLLLDVLKRDQAPWPVILLGASAVATVLMVIQVISGGGDETIAQLDETFDLDPYLGMYVALIAAGVALIGAILDYADARRTSPATA